MVKSGADHVNRPWCTTKTNATEINKLVCTVSCVADSQILIRTSLGLSNYR